MRVQVVVQMPWGLWLEGGGDGAMQIEGGFGRAGCTSRVVESRGNVNIPFKIM